MNVERAMEVVERVLGVEAEADGVEVVVLAGDHGYTRFANNAVIQDSRVEDVNVSIRAVVNGGIGTAVTNDLSTEGLGRAVARASASAHVVGGGSFPGFDDGSTPVPTVQAFDPQTADLEPGQKAAGLQPLFQRTTQHGLLAAGSLHTSLRTVAIGNSLGLRRGHQGTTADVRISALEGLRPGDASGYAGTLGVSYGEIDLDALGRRAVDKVLQGRRPRAIEPATYDVLLEPSAVAELLEWMGYLGFSSTSIQDGQSFMSERMGESITGPRVTIIDDGPGKLGHGVPAPFDGEGTPKQTLTLIDAGVARTGVYDRASAGQLGEVSTGHLPVGADTPGATPTHLVMLGGDDTPEALLDRLDKGLWITRFHYVNGNVDPRQATMTGLTRDGTFWVEGGKVRHGVQNLRFTQSMLDAFQRIDGLSRQLTSTATWWSSFGSVTTPWMLLRGFAFTGSTSE